MAGAYRHSDAIDCASFLGEGKLATKSTDGRVIIWDWAVRKGSVTWKVGLP
jgi:WD40 repeat protein